MSTRVYKKACCVSHRTSSIVTIEVIAGTVLRPVAFTEGEKSTPDYKNTSATHRVIAHGRVIEILHVDDRKKCACATSYYNPTFEYRIGKIVEAPVQLRSTYNKVGIHVYLRREDAIASAVDGAVASSAPSPVGASFEHKKEGPIDPAFIASMIESRRQALEAARIKRISLSGSAAAPAPTAKELDEKIQAADALKRADAADAADASDDDVRSHLFKLIVPPHTSVRSGKKPHQPSDDHTEPLVVDPPTFSPRPEITRVASSLRPVTPDVSQSRTPSPVPASPSPAAPESNGLLNKFFGESIAAPVAPVAPPRKDNLG